MDTIIQYVKNEKDEIENRLKVVNKKILNCKYNVEEIEKAINNLTKNIDTTYEVFSPNAFDKDYNIVEIEKLNLKKNEILLDVNSIIDEQKMLVEKKEKIDKVLENITKVEKEILAHSDNTKYLVNKETNRLENEYVSEITKLLEYQINKQNRYISKNVKKEIELLNNKITLCQNFIDIDVNRAKIELIKLQEDINSLNKKIQSEMFHVKHFLDKNEKISLYDEVKTFISEFKKTTDFKIDYNYTGGKINISNIYLANTIRIVKESIENAVFHSKGNIITVNVIVDEFNNEESNDATVDDSNDMHQINFVLDSESNININIKISDNGEGFSIQEDNVLLSNNMYGIYMMKQRAKNIKGLLDIQSEEGMGTTVSLLYTIEDCSEVEVI